MRIFNLEYTSKISEYPSNMQTTKMKDGIHFMYIKRGIFGFLYANQSCSKNITEKGKGKE
jgi:hypothetical protein